MELAKGDIPGVGGRVRVGIEPNLGGPAWIRLFLVQDGSDICIGTSLRHSRCNATRDQQQSQDQIGCPNPKSNEGTHLGKKLRICGG
jgi:hypothetical protein